MKNFFLPFLKLPLRSIYKFFKLFFMILYVGNIFFGLSEDQLREVFERYGRVESVKIMRDRETGRSRGFGFVEMENDQDAELAKNELNGAEVGGRTLRVNYAARQN